MDTNKLFKILVMTAMIFCLFGSVAATGSSGPRPYDLPSTTITVQPATGGVNAGLISITDNSGSNKGTSTTGNIVVSVYPGTYTVTITKSSYSTITQTVVIPDGSTTPTPVVISYALVKVPPAAPSNLTATVISSTAVQLSWLDNSADEEHYIIFRNGIALETIPANSISYVDNSATEGSSYTYFVRAFDDDTDTYTNSNTISITVVTLPVKPVVTATAISPTEIKLTWADLPNEESYTLENKDSAGTWQLSARLAQNANNYTIQNLAEKTTYIYRLTAINKFGSVTSSDVSITTPETNLAVTASISDVDAGDTADFNVKVTNWLGYDIENVQGTVTIKSGISEDVDFKDLAKGASDTVSIELDIPLSADADDYDVTADLTWEDAADNDEHDDSFTLGALDVNQQTHAIGLTDVFLTTSKVAAGDEARVMLTVKNTGKNDEDVTIKLSNADLGIETLSLEVPKGSSVPAIIKLEVPEDAKSGSYPFTLSATYSGKTATADKVIVSVTGATTTTTTEAKEPATSTGIEQVPIWLIGLLVFLGVILAIEVALRAQYNNKRAQPVMVRARDY